MPRAILNTTCDLIRPVNHIDSGDVYDSVSCRLVPLLTEFPDVEPLAQRVAYVTMEDAVPVGPTVTREGLVYRFNYGDADLLAIPSGAGVTHQVLWVESIAWKGQPAYVRAIVRESDGSGSQVTSFQAKPTIAFGDSGSGPQPPTSNAAISFECV